MEARFNKIYENQNYFDRYNGSVLGTIFFLIVFFLVFSYAYIRRRIDPIKNNWSEQRCSPAVIPFAGFINAPSNSNKFEFTANNFNYCIKNIIKEMASFAVIPLESVSSLIGNIFKYLSEAVNELRKIIAEIRSSVDDITRNIMERLLNIVIPFQQMVIVTKSIFSKTHGVLVTGMYNILAGLIITMSTLFNIQRIVNALIVAALAAIAAMWAIPFVGFEMAMAATAALTAVTVPFALITGAIGKMEKTTGLKPSCFKKGTLLRGIDNILYSIESIPLGTHLMEGGYVTGVMKLDATNETMYNLGNITVSGSHVVKYEESWVYVRNHPDARPIQNFTDKYIYCINTSLKKIHTDDFIFMDWDEVDIDKLDKFKCNTPKEIHEKIDNGFHPDTYISVKGKGKIKIRDAEVGDILTSGEKIRGIVKISNEKELYVYKDFIATKGISEIQKLTNLDSIKLDPPTLSNKSSPFIYHLLTDTGDFFIKETKVKDYNWNIDYYSQ